MLKNFFKPAGRKDYAVKVLTDKTSQAAVNRVKRNRFAAPFKAVAAFALVAVALGGGLATTASAATTTATHANADIISQLVCIDGNAGDDVKGNWSAGANRYANMGGRSAFSMEKITASTIVSGVSVFGVPSRYWHDSTNGQFDYGRNLTAYEKYGMQYPQFDAWLPVFADKTYTFKGSGYVGDPMTYNQDGKIPPSWLGPSTLEPGSNKLTTTSALSCLGTLPAIESGVANIISMPARFIVSVALELYGASYGTSISQEGSVLYPIGQAINGLINNPGGLRDTLFVPFIIPLILIGAIWVAWIGIVKRAATAALQSTVWMVAAIAAGTVFLAQPTLISGAIDYGVASIQTTINGVVLSGGKANDMCELGGTGDPQKVVREIKCSIWYSTVYAPWVSGQFGSSVNSASSADPARNGDPVMTNDPRGFLNSSYIEYGWQRTVKSTTWPQLMVDRQATNQSLDIAEVAFAQLSGQGMPVNNVWAGGTMNQISASILMGFGAIASTIVLFVYGFMLLIYQFMMIVAVLLSPLFFLFGIIPNWGRRVLMRYAELLVSVGVKRIITSLLLAIYFLFYQMITSTGSLFLQIILVLALAIFALVARGRFVNLFTQGINFGGNKSIGLPGAKAAGVAAGIGGGLLATGAGGIIAGVLTGRAVKKKVNAENSDLANDPNRISLTGGEGSPTADVRATPQQRQSNPIGDINRGVKTLKDTKETYDTAQSAVGKISGRGGNGSPSSDSPTSGKPTGQGNTPSPNGSPGPRGNASAAGGNPAAPAGRPFSPGLGKGAATGNPAAGVAPKVPAGGMPPFPGAGASGAAGSSGAAGAGTAGATGAAGAAGAGAAVAPAVGGAAAGVGAGGAAGAAGGAGAVGGAGAAGAAAAGGGAVATGAAAGSVVPVVGTAVGAAAGAVVVSVAAKKRQQQKDDSNE